MTETGPEAGRRWALTLYVSGASPRSAEAIDTVRRICDGELAGRVDLSILDVGDQPELAVRDDIFVVPTLVKRLPEPVRHLVGDLTDLARVRAALGIDSIADARRPATKSGSP